jgi:tRNA pseudouridine55 synthase
MNSEETKPKYLILTKKEGETPLECLKRFRMENREYETVKMTYAGRLDPLAYGQLLVLVGEECKNKDKYLGLNKTYRVKVLFGVVTDTHDVLGLVNSSSRHCEEALRRGNPGIVDVIKSFIGKFTQDYPDYSSKTIGGKAMFVLAKLGLLKDVDKPTKEVEIFDIKFLGRENIPPKILQQEIIRKIGLVSGDFRQKEILTGWDKFFAEDKLDNLEILEILVHCSSGTYMRSLADDIGKKLGCKALAWEIERTGIDLFN